MLRQAEAGVQELQNRGLGIMGWFGKQKTENRKQESEWEAEFGMFVF